MQAKKYQSLAEEMWKHEQVNFPFAFMCGALSASDYFSLQCHRMDAFAMSAEIRFDTGFYQKKALQGFQLGQPCV